MNTEALCSVLVSLTEKTSEVERVTDLLGMLQHAFLSAFGVSLSPASELSNSPHRVPSLDSGEEAKLLVVKAVRNFHVCGRQAHAAFFRNRDYHPQAALFLLELLKSLSGNSQQWFRQLQMECMDSCLAILETIGEENVRLCAPGVVSATVRYIHRAHHGKDSHKVRVAAMHLLNTCLSLSFETGAPSSWAEEAVARLTLSLRPLLEPTALVRGGYDISMLTSLHSFTKDLLSSPGMEAYLVSPLASMLVVAYALIDNALHLQQMGKLREPDVELLQSGGGATHEKDPIVSLSVQTTSFTAPSASFLVTPTAIAFICEALECLRGVELLHVATTVARHHSLREQIFKYATFSALSSSPPSSSGPFGHLNDGGQESSSALAVLMNVVRKCIRVVGTEMNEEDLFTCRRPRSYPAGVVDEFLMCFARALSELPAGSNNIEVGDVEETFGEHLTNTILDECDAILQDWEVYATHPAVLYVVTRLLLWQFEESTSSLGTSPETERDDGGVYPLASDFITSGAFEQLWSVVAPPHLWNITEDEELCSYQQLRHRQVVAATLLRFLSLTADALSVKRVRFPSLLSEDSEAIERLFALTLYLVLEKAATSSSVVHEAAMQCLEAYSSASNEGSPVVFLLRHTSLIMDEAARAVRVEYLRPAAANVLRGSLTFVEHHLLQPQHCRPTNNRASSVQHTSSYKGSNLHLTSVIRQRMSVAAMTALFQSTSVISFVTMEEAAQIADFVSTTIHVARDTLEQCSRYDISLVGEDEAGRRAALMLLRDAFDLASFLNFCVPQEALDVDQERLTTSAHTRVRELQQTVLDSIYDVLKYSTLHNSSAPIAVQAVLRGLTTFLTTSSAVNWIETERARKEELTRLRDAGRRGSYRLLGTPADQECADDEVDEPSESSPSPPPPINWPWTNVTVQVDRCGDEAVTSLNSVTIELPRSHLHTVYRVYLSLFAILREPIAAFQVARNTVSTRTGVEKRRLTEVSIMPGLFAVLNGLESICILATDFLIHRMVEEVLPYVLVWYERGALPRIPTDTDERVKQAAYQFALHLCEYCETDELRDQVQSKCAAFFVVQSKHQTGDRGKCDCHQTVPNEVEEVRDATSTALDLLPQKMPDDTPVRREAEKSLLKSST